MEMTMPVEIHPTPTKEGFYWAKWKIADPGTYPNHPQDEHVLLKDWEVVNVWESGSPGSGDMAVHLVGVEKCQSLDCFFWGPGPLKEPDQSSTR